MMQTLNTKIVSFAEILNGKESAFIIPSRLVYILKLNGSMKIDGQVTFQA